MPPWLARGSESERGLRAQRHVVKLIGQRHHVLWHQHGTAAFDHHHDHDHNYTTAELYDYHIHVQLWYRLLLDLSRRI